MKKDNRFDKQFLLLLTQRTFDALTHASAVLGVSRSAIVRAAIQAYLKDMVTELKEK